MRMKIVNLTPHVVRLQRPDGSADEYLSAGIARCSTTEVVVGEIDGVPVVRTTFGAVTGLPEDCPECGGSYHIGHSDECSDSIRYVVSQMVAAALPNRPELIFPARLIRDDQGRVLACSAWGAQGAA